jgi:hypothetical protein
MNISLIKLQAVVTAFLIIILPTKLNASSGSWLSKTTGTNITYTLTDANAPLKDGNGNYFTVVYLENLGIKKLGNNTNTIDVNWLLSKGYRVIELNYLNNATAISPNINDDIIAINNAISAGSFCGKTNCSKYRSYVLFEGYRIARDVSYYLDDPTVYNYSDLYTTGDSLFMDIIYPANTSVKVPVVLSFSYSNSYFENSNQRLNLAYTLAGFDDSFLEGAPANGIAWAIADHPKYCDWGQGKPVGGANKAYGSFEVNPDAARKVKSAVRTLRVLGEGMGLSGKIGIFGFSRGSDAGSMAVGDRSVPDFENYGLQIGITDDVQAAALGPGVFDFTQIYNTLNDGDSNLESRCPVVWGSLDSNDSLWQTMGSAYLAQTSATAPVIFFYNTDDSHYYQDQIAHFKVKLDALGVATSTLINFGTGHAVPQTSSSLTTLYNFFNQYLTPPSVLTEVNEVRITETNSLNLSITSDKENIHLKFNLYKASKVQITLYDLSGIAICTTQNKYNKLGIQYETLNLKGLNLPSGIYFVKIMTEDAQELKKVFKQNV